jgi:hypothetical protein
MIRPSYLSSTKWNFPEANRRQFVPEDSANISTFSIIDSLPLKKLSVNKSIIYLPNLIIPHEIKGIPLF